MADINERVARLRGWTYIADAKLWTRGRMRSHEVHDGFLGAPPYTTDPTLILELVEDAKISVVWNPTNDEWDAVRREFYAEPERWVNNKRYGTAVALAWLAGEE